MESNSGRIWMALRLVYLITLYLTVLIGMHHEQRLGKNCDTDQTQSCLNTDCDSIIKTNLGR